MDRARFTKSLRGISKALENLSPNTQTQEADLRALAYSAATILLAKYYRGCDTDLVQEIGLAGLAAMEKKLEETNPENN